MARVWLAYSQSDGAVSEAVTSALRHAGHTVVRPDRLNLPADFKESLSRDIAAADVVVALLTPAFWASPFLSFELGLARASEIQQARPRLLAIRLDGAPVPSILASGHVVNATEAALEDALPELARLVADPPPTLPEASLASGLAQAFIAIPSASDAKIERLREAVRSNRLVLFAGAGVSMSAGIPSWELLVDRVLGEAFSGVVSPSLALTAEEVAALLRLSSKASELVLAQHARRSLGGRFPDVVRDQLYKDAAGTSALLTAIARLTATGAIRGVVNFNFDDLLERAVAAVGVDHEVVFGPGQLTRGNGVPIFHVHGYLPQHGVPVPHPLVFAETDYNEESLDPYRWSTLVQISYLAEYTCLFAGVSVLDPNLRRLLEVVKRQSTNGSVTHFVIRRRTQPESLPDYPIRPLMGMPTARRAARVIDALHEADLNDLGLQTLWVDSFGQIPNVIDTITTSVA
jgi:hypothetical protein